MTDTVALSLPKTGFKLDTWTSYSFYSNFLTPVDNWHVSFGHEDPPRTLLAALRAGERVSLSVNGHIQGDGYIDDVVVSQASGSGTTITLEGRDRLAQMLDSNMDPRKRLPETQTLEDFVRAVAAPFGWGAAAQITDTNAANQNVLTGQNRGIRTTTKGRYLKQVLKHRLKPYPNEGALHFLSRVTERHGLHVWLSADGTQLVVGKPSFDQGTLGHLTRIEGNADVANNILHGTVRSSLKSQPSIVVAQCRGGGGEFPKSRLTRYMQNPQIACDNSAIQQAYPDAKEVFVLDGGGSPLPTSGFKRITSTVPRPMFLEDDESKTPEELENFVRREMALKMRHGFTAHYTVDGHTQNGSPWAVDTMVRVDDDRCDVHEPLYVLARTFTKSRTDGTKTHLELIRPHSMVF